MVQVQIISKILNDKNWEIVENNLLDSTFFTGYEKEFEFIKSHYDTYKKVPDELTFLEKFPDFDIVSVSESDEYLIDKIKEEHLYEMSAPLLQKAADLYKDDANKAVEYIINNFKNITPNYKIGGVDIVSNAKNRFDSYIDRRNNQDKYYFSTGLKELDEITHGIQRGEEFFVIFARVNQGKSWLLEKFCVEVWKQGFNVGYFSPEMTAESVGYRFDTLNKNFSNSTLTWGKSSNNDDKYKKYLNELSKNDNKLVVSTPVDFNRKVTVSKLRNWVKQEKLDMIALDGLTYISDERGKRSDNKTTTMTNISEDLMSLSVELSIPILAVIQANRNAVDDENEKLPDLEHIRDSDGVAHNCSTVISLKQKFGVLEIGVKKQRNGKVGDVLKYSWNIDTGEFVWIPSSTESISDEELEESVEKSKQIFNDIGDVF